MKSDFFTFGGGHAWEDVFFYQKWRIQRNYTSKKCRLLDNWDIRRHEGTFEECRKAFIKYIEAYELARQKGHMVIMIPGLGESKNVFKPLWREVLKDRFMVAAINYPSTQKRIEGHVRQLDFFLNHLEDVNKVSFVTSGIGGIVLKALFSLESPWRKRLKIGRIVEVAPKNHGSKLLVRLSKNKLLGFILGPMAAEMGQLRIEVIPPYPREIETGIILSESAVERAMEALTGTKGHKTSVTEEKKFTGAKAVIKINNLHWNIFNNPKVVEKVVNFLKNGTF